MERNIDDDLVPFVAPVDDPPKGGVWAEEHVELTDEEAAAGNALGEQIDIDDDLDAGDGGKMTGQVQDD